MAKLHMCKIEIVSLLRDSRSIVERLQRRGVVELTDVSDDRLVKINTSSSVNRLERNISSAVSALEVLNKYTGYKEPVTEMLNGRKKMTTHEFAKAAETAYKTLADCLSILDCSKKINEMSSLNAKAQTEIDVLSPWENMNLALGFKGTAATRAFIGTFPQSVTDEFVRELMNGENGEIPVCVNIYSQRKEQTCLAVVCHKDSADVVLNVLRDGGFVPLNREENKTASQIIAAQKLQIEQNGKKSEEYENKIKSFAKSRDDIRFLLDYLVMRRDKYSAINRLAMTDSTVIITGYIPQKYTGGLIREFDSKYTVAISISEPSEDEDTPVLLENGKFSQPVEGITEMYALPNKRDVDPSSVMAFFYYLFFGMMLSDAGYGLLMLIGTTVVLKKFSVEGTLRRSLRMFRYCGISTLFWGALFGSWFGDLPQVIASNFFGVTIKTTALWFEPLNDPIKLLLFSFALGIAHLFLGLAVNFKMLWSEGRKLDAVCEVVPIYVTILGVAPVAASILTSVPAAFISVGKYLAIIGAVSILLTSGRSGRNVFMRFFGGLYGLYNVATGYLSDILSYSRLLALGLATGSIAGVINLIATMPQNTVIKAVMLIVVGVIGHTANMGINLLGAYVHSDRLQFVELFSKFYEGGGRAFAPLKADTKYIKFEKENIYE